MSSSFPTRLRGVPAVSVRRPLAQTDFILSCASSLLQSFSRHRPPGTHVRAPSLGSPPSSRHQSAESTSAGIPSPLRSVLDVSHVLDGLLLHRPRRFISPCYHVQGSLFRGFPRREAVRARRSPLPSCRSRAVPAPGKPGAPELRARLQGLAPLADPSPTRSGLDSAWLDPLLSFILPRVLLCGPCRRPSPPVSDHGLSRPSSC